MRIIAVTGLAGTGKSVVLEKLINDMQEYNTNIKIGYIGTGILARKLAREEYDSRVIRAKELRKVGNQPYSTVQEVNEQWVIDRLNQSEEGFYPQEEALRNLLRHEVNQRKEDEIVILDGFPRTPAQVSWMVQQEFPILGVFVLDASTKVRHSRVSSRGRDDIVSWDKVDGLQRDTMHLTVNALTMGTNYHIFRINTDCHTISDTAVILETIVGCI